MSPRVFPGWVLENFKLVAAGKPSGHSNLGLDRSSEVPLRAAGVAGPKKARRSQLLRDATFFSLRKLCLWKFGYYCTEVPIWGRTCRCPLGGVQGRRIRSKHFAPTLRWSSSKIIRCTTVFRNGGLLP